MTYSRTPERPRHVAIVGSRHLNDYRKFCTTLRSLHILRPDTVIVSGACPVGDGGIDGLAARFARQNSYTLLEFPVDMELVRQKESEGLDRRAAFGFAATARNTLIVQDSDLMVVIACSHSVGVYDSIRKMKAKIESESVPGRERGQTIRLYHYIWECSRK